MGVVFLTQIFGPVSKPKPSSDSPTSLGVQQQLGGHTEGIESEGFRQLEVLKPPTNMGRRSRCRVVVCLLTIMIHKPPCKGAYTKPRLKKPRGEISAPICGRDCPHPLCTQVLIEPTWVDYSDRRGPGATCLEKSLGRSSLARGCDAP